MDVQGVPKNSIDIRDVVALMRINFQEGHWWVQYALDIRSFGISSPISVLHYIAAVSEKGLLRDPA